MFIRHVYINLLTRSKIQQGLKRSMSNHDTLGLEHLGLGKPAVPSRTKKRKGKRATTCLPVQTSVSPLDPPKLYKDHQSFTLITATDSKATAVPLVQRRLFSRHSESTVQTSTLSVLMHRDLQSPVLTSNTDTPRPAGRSLSLRPSSVEEGQAHHQPT